MMISFVDFERAVRFKATSHPRHRLTPPLPSPSLLLPLPLLLLIFLLLLLILNTPQQNKKKRARSAAAAQTEPKSVLVRGTASPLQPTSKPSQHSHNKPSAGTKEQGATYHDIKLLKREVGNPSQPAHY